MITPKIESRLFQFVTHKILETPGMLLHAIGAVEDHMHISISPPPTIKPSEWIGKLKGSSSHHINQLFGHKTLEWQHGYGIVSFDEEVAGKNLRGLHRIQSFAIDTTLDKTVLVRSL